jgi:steroid 5-alpha reductase family enzyme
MTVFAFLVALVLIAAALSAIMTLAWVIQQRTGNSGWVDTVWTFGLGLVGIVAGLAPAGQSDASWRGVVVAAFFVVWALRLGLHIARRTAGITDDPRYAELIKGWGASARSEMFWLLQKQALVSIPLAAGAVIAAHNPDPHFRLADAIAIGIMLAALAGEAVADRQLRQFRSDGNAGRICDVGLWRYSRHPNYFFEWLGWLAFPLLAISLTGSYPLGWLALAAPVCMYWLLVHVSGIPPLEEHMLRSRGAAYKAYQRRTSAFFPRPPSVEGRTT